MEKGVSLVIGYPSRKRFGGLPQQFRPGAAEYQESRAVGRSVHKHAEETEEVPAQCWTSSMTISPSRCSRVSLGSANRASSVGSSKSKNATGPVSRAIRLRASVVFPTWRAPHETHDRELAEEGDGGPLRDGDGGS